MTAVACDLPLCNVFLSLSTLAGFPLLLINNFPGHFLGFKVIQFIGRRSIDIFNPSFSPTFLLKEGS